MKDFINKSITKFNTKNSIITPNQYKQIQDLNILNLKKFDESNDEYIFLFNLLKVNDKLKIDKIIDSGDSEEEINIYLTLTEDKTDEFVRSFNIAVKNNIFEKRIMLLRFINFNELPKTFLSIDELIDNNVFVFSK